MSSTDTQHGSKSQDANTAIERQLLKMMAGKDASSISGSAATVKTVEASSESMPTPDGWEQSIAQQEDANANVTPLPLTPKRRVTPAGRKARLKALSSIQELIAARKQLLIGLYSNRPYSTSLRTEAHTVLDDQQKFWALLARKRKIYEQDEALFSELGDAIREHLDHTQRHGSFKQHLQKCAEAGAEQQLFLIAELGKRLEAASMLNQDEVPTAVIAAYKALRMQIPGPVLAQQLAEHADTSDPIPSAGADNSINKVTSPALINARKETLLVRMEELTRVQLDPRERARQVKALKAQWDDMNRADTEYAQSLAQRFSQIGEKAYEPSRKYFKALARKLAQNLSKRSELATSLRDYYAETDWNDVEWKSVESTLSAVRQQWKAHAPTEREKTRPIKHLFETSYRNIDELLQREYDRNAQEGQNLVELMSSLGRQKASSASLEAMLGVQNRWKKIGLLRAADRRELKKQLSDRASIVKLNRKKQLLQMQEFRNSRREAITIVQQVESFLNRDNDDLLDQRHDLIPLRDRFRAFIADTETMQLDGRQAAAVQNLNDVFGEKYASVVEKIEHLMQERRVNALDAYHEASRLIGNAEVTFVVGSGRSDVLNAADLAGDYLDGVRFLPRNGHALLMNRLNFLHRAKE